MNVLRLFTNRGYNPQFFLQISKKVKVKLVCLTTWQISVAFFSIIAPPEAQPPVSSKNNIFHSNICMNKICIYYSILKMCHVGLLFIHQCPGFR